MTYGMKLEDKTSLRYALRVVEASRGQPSGLGEHVLEGLRDDKLITSCCLDCDAREYPRDDCDQCNATCDELTPQGLKKLEELGGPFPYRIGGSA